MLGRIEHVVMVTEQFLKKKKCQMQHILLLNEPPKLNFTSIMMKCVFSRPNMHVINIPVIVPDQF